jgi:hypothetical protein
MIKQTVSILVKCLILAGISCSKRANSNKISQSMTLVDSLKSIEIEDSLSWSNQNENLIFWRKDKISKILIDTNLSHQKGFEYDSIVGIDYIGFEGEHSFNPVNNEGEFISSIKKSKKLNESQIAKLFSILTDKNTYENPQIVACYEPRLAFIYYNGDVIIGQTQICLSCASLHSTAKTISKEHGGLFNTQATKKLDSLRIELGLNSKMSWE